MSTIGLRIMLYAGGGTLFAGTAYVTAVVVAPAPEYKPSNEERQSLFEKLAPSYETSSRQQEVYLGIGRLRKRALKEHATGTCLEVGAGTGHNIGLYPTEAVERVVMCDRANAMVSAMRQKINIRLGYDPAVATPEWLKLPADASVPVKTEASSSSSSSGEGNAADGEKKASKKKSSAKDADAAQEEPPYALQVCSSEQLPFPDNSFDTVVDVFGLCSYDQPTLALREMSRVCKPEGNLVLIEHGRGTWGRINWYLDKWAPRHANSWGCWWNRDMRRYMRLAGIKTVTREEKHFGTTHYVVAKPWKPRCEVEAAKAAAAGAE
jgi:ubiquinone/menaquinone biosynthesis C-methylase UbiE